MADFQVLFGQVYFLESLTKQRDILFSTAYESGDAAGYFVKDQAKAAIFLLADVDGVLDLQYLSGSHLIITYDVRVLTLDILHQALVSVGFHLDNSLLSKIKNALYAYTENTLRENLGIMQNKVTRDIFMQGYQRRLHGCRDQRPTHWRHYL